MNDSTHVRPLILVIDNEAICAYLSALIQENANTIDASHLVAGRLAGSWNTCVPLPCGPSYASETSRERARTSDNLPYFYDSPICRYVREPIME